MPNPFLFGWLGNQHDVLSRLGSAYRSGSSVSSDPNPEVGQPRARDPNEVREPVSPDMMQNPSFAQPGMSRDEFEKDYYSRGNLTFGAPSFADQQVDAAYEKYISGQTKQPMENNYSGQPYGFGGSRREMMSQFMNPMMNPMMGGLGFMGGFGMPYGMGYGGMPSYGGYGGYGMPSYGGFYGGLGSLFGGDYF